MISFIVAAVVGIAILAAALGACLALSARVRSLEQRLAAVEVSSRAPVLPEAPFRESPLQGLRIAVSIIQDHPQPIFANLLKELLMKEDVLDVSFLPEPSAETDIFITGTLTCNAYAEIYFRADITAYAGSEPLCTITEAPPGG